VNKVILISFYYECSDAPTFGTFSGAHEQFWPDARSASINQTRFLRFSFAVF